MDVEDPNRPAPPLGVRVRWHRRPGRPGVSHFLNFFWVVFGLIFAVTGYHTWSVVQPVSGGATTTGTVVSVAQGEDCGRYGCSRTWTPTIQFQTPDGATHAFVGPTVSSTVHQGQHVRVSYLPSNPSIAHDLSVSGGKGIFFLVLGVLSLLLGVGSFLAGLSSVHRRTGLTPAREGTGWVGHRTIHSNPGLVAAFVVLVGVLVVSGVVSAH